MKTIVNKTHVPVRVPLPRGKVLHLGPLKKGQISHNDLDHEPLKRMLEAGQIEVEGDSTETTESSPHEHSKVPHAETRGHHPPTSAPIKGDR
jgi:hypothetical protein